MNSLKRQHGFSIYEAIAAAIVFAIVVAGYTSMSRMLSNMRDHYTIEAQALMLVDNVVERVGSGEVSQADFDDALQDEVARSNVKGNARLSGQLLEVGEQSVVIISHRSKDILRMEVGQ
jgi:Tfp pilus assembly protein PilV